MKESVLKEKSLKNIFRNFWLVGHCNCVAYREFPIPKSRDYQSGEGDKGELREDRKAKFFF